MKENGQLCVALLAGEFPTHNINLLRECVYVEIDLRVETLIASFIVLLGFSICRLV
jgi:hypothetical protein